MLASPHLIDVAQHVGIVHLIARRIHRQRSLDYADLVGEGLMALVKAASMFDPEQGVKFTSYASVAIRRRLWRLASTHQRACARKLPATLAEPTPDPRPAEHVAHLLGKLPEQERLAVELRYGIDGLGPRSYRQVGEIMGISHELARSRVKDALARLRTYAS